MRFSQYLLAAASVVGLVAAAPSEKINKRVSKMKFFGINESGPEFGDGKIPGIKNTDYVWPNTTTFSSFTSKGFNVFRINFMMERLTPSLTGGFSAQYLADLKSTVQAVTNLGAFAMLCPHNYGRFNGQVITDVNGFQTWWRNVAAQFAGNNLVMFDTNNEYNTMPQSLVVQLNQAAINGIRSAGATSQWITPEGNSWTGAWTWTTNDNGGGTNGATMGALTDPSNKLIYQMHQYLDSDGSGTSATCVSSTVGAERIAAATQWLRANKKLGMIGEFAGGANSQCQQAVNGMLSAMDAASDVWTGAIWWAAGPWWGNYIYSIEPANQLGPIGPANAFYLNDLTQFE